MAPPCRPRRCSLVHRPCLPSFEPPCHTPCCSNRHNHPGNGLCQPQPCKTRYHKRSLSRVQETSCSALDPSCSYEDVTDVQDCKKSKHSGKSSCSYKIPKPKSTCSIKPKRPCRNQCVEQSTSTDDICPVRVNKGCGASPATCDEETITCNDEPAVSVGCSCTKSVIFEQCSRETKTKHTCPPSDSLCPAEPKPCKSILIRPKVEDIGTQCDNDKANQKEKKKPGGCSDQGAKVDCECAKEMKKKKKSVHSVETQKSQHDKRKWKSDRGVQQSTECPVCTRKKNKRIKMEEVSPFEEVSCNEMKENMIHDSKCSCADGIGSSSDDDMCTKLGCEFVSEVELASVVEPVCNMVKHCSLDGECTSTDGELECNCKYPPAFGQMPCTGALSDTCQCRLEYIDL